MGSLRQILLYYSYQPQPNPTIKTTLYTISGVEVMDMTAARWEASEFGGEESIRP
jgi:hypothetical protein